MTFSASNNSRLPRSLERPLGSLALYWMLAATALLLPMFLMLRQGYIGSMDLDFYAKAQRFFTEQLSQGEWYPRWLTSANAGFGAPVFIFYPPLAFYVGSLCDFLLAVLGVTDAEGTVTLTCNLWFATFASGASGYYWLRRRFPHDPALARAASLLYTLFPYRLFYLYFDFSPGQCWALAWFPLILCALDGLARPSGRAVALLTLSYSVLLLTHIPSSITFLPVSMGYMLLAAPFQPTRRALLAAVSASILALALTAFYWLPLLCNEEAAHFATGAFSGTFHYSHNFITLDFWITAPFILGALYVLWRTPETRARYMGWSLLILLVMSMMTPLSRPLWAALPPLQTLQFPVKRFYGPLLPLLATLWALLWRITEISARRGQARLLMACFCALPLLYVGAAYRQTGWPLAPTPFITHEREVLAESGVILPHEYGTEWTSQFFMTPEALLTAKNELPARLEQGEGTVRVERWSARQIVLDLDVTSQNALMRLHRFMFPGWRVTPPFALTAGPIRGDMQLSVPRGAHRVTLDFAALPGERTGRCITLAASLALLLLMMARSRRPSLTLKAA